jgi:hypothetical protein
MFPMSKVATRTPRAVLPFNPELAELGLYFGLTFWIITEILWRGMISFIIRLIDGGMIIVGLV